MSTECKKSVKACVCGEPGSNFGKLSRALLVDEFVSGGSLSGFLAWDSLGVITLYLVYVPMIY